MLWVEICGKNTKPNWTFGNSLEIKSQHAHTLNKLPYKASQVLQIVGHRLISQHLWRFIKR